jgi:hypothetical protein
MCSELILPFLGVPDHGVSGWWGTLHAAAEGEDAHGGHRHLLPLSGQPIVMGNYGTRLFAESGSGTRLFLNPDPDPDHRFS